MEDPTGPCTELLLLNFPQVVYYILPGGLGGRGRFVT